ncbi:MAG: flagellar motor protein MotB [Vicinamibacterales bacterium]
MSRAPIIVIKKNRHAAHGHHGGAWKVAFADFMTAMMAFFLVMWIVGQSKATKAGLAGYFRDPGVLEHQRSTGILPGATAGIATEGPPPVPAPSKVEDDIDQASLERSAQRIRDMLSKLPDFDKIKGQIEIQATPDGMRIELIDSSEGTFFDSASAQLKPATEKILGVIGHELTSLHRPVVVEGHTDSRPYNKSDGYTNWELSADRANAARRQMERTGLDPKLIRAVRGLADRELANAKDPFDARNRRVSILVVAHAGGAVSLADGHASKPGAAPAAALDGHQTAAVREHAAAAPQPEARPHR